MFRHEFRYPSTTESEERMLDDLERVLESSGVTVEAGRGFTLAVCEAFTNALLHGNQTNQDKTIHLVLEVNENGISADITDEGTGGLDKIRRRKRRGLMAEGGRGIDLIEHYADSMSFSEAEKGGLTVSIFVSHKRKQNTHV
jgi:serine/threonine-protein kinase RsbW